MAPKKTTTASKTTKAKAAPAKTVAKPTEKAGAVAPKRSRTKAAITKPVAAAKAVRTVPVAAIKSEAGSGDEVNKKALVERFMAESGMKKGDARRAVDAMLNVLSAAIHEGKDIAAAPLGKIKIVRKKQTPNGELAVLRVKLRDPNKQPKPKPVADAAE